jgi:hypothetical protein
VTCCKVCQTENRPDPEHIKRMKITLQVAFADTNKVEGLRSTSWTAADLVIARRYMFKLVRGNNFYTWCLLRIATGRHTMQPYTWIRCPRQLDGHCISLVHRPKICCYNRWYTRGAWRWRHPFLRINVRRSHDIFRVDAIVRYPCNLYQCSTVVLLATSQQGGTRRMESFQLTSHNLPRDSNSGL